MLDILLVFVLPIGFIIALILFQIERIKKDKKLNKGHLQDHLLDNVETHLGAFLLLTLFLTMYYYIQRYHHSGTTGVEVFDKMFIKNSIHIWVLGYIRGILSASVLLFAFYVFNHFQFKVTSKYTRIFLNQFYKETGFHIKEVGHGIMDLDNPKHVIIYKHNEDYYERPLETFSHLYFVLLLSWVGLVWIMYGMAKSITALLNNKRWDKNFSDFNDKMLDIKLDRNEKRKLFLEFSQAIILNPTKN